MVGVLVNSGRQLEAFNLVYAFELTEQFDPVSLLKAYLEARKVQVKAGNSSPAAQVGFSLIKMPYHCRSTDGSVGKGISPSSRTTRDQSLVLALFIKDLCSMC